MTAAQCGHASGSPECPPGADGDAETFETAVGRLLEAARGWRLAELRNRRGLSREQIARRMAVPIARICQIEDGDVSSQDVLNSYINALGGTPTLIADFGDEQLKVA